jgi:nucleotidyltransferase/DNA polymerase involved in DNA repair
MEDTKTVLPQVIDSARAQIVMENLLSEIVAARAQFAIIDISGVQSTPMPLTDIWGIAGRLAWRLTELGIDTPLALKKTDARFIRERFSVTLERTVRELQGTPCIALEEAPPDRKTIMVSRSFGRMVTDRREMEEAIASYASRAAEKMRRQDLAAGRIMVFMQTNPFLPQDAQYARDRMIALPVATAHTGIIIAAAQRALGTIWRPGSPGYRTNWDELLTVGDTPRQPGRC